MTYVATYDRYVADGTAYLRATFPLPGCNLTRDTTSGEHRFGGWRPPALVVRRPRQRRRRGPLPRRSRIRRAAPAGRDARRQNPSTAAPEMAPPGSPPFTRLHCSATDSSPWSTTSRSRRSTAIKRRRPRITAVSVTLTYEEGTIRLAGDVPEDLPGVRRDDRSKTARAPAYRYAAIRDALAECGVPVDDGALDLPPLTLESLRTPRVPADCPRRLAWRR